MEEKGIKIYQKWWFWIIIIVVIGIAVIVTLHINSSNEKDVTRETVKQSSSSINTNIGADELSIDDFRQALIDNNLKIDEITDKYAHMLGAVEGYEFTINGESFEIYKFNENITDELSQENLKTVKEYGYITVLGLKFQAKYNKGLVLVNYENHINKNKILQIFNSL